MPRKTERKLVIEQIEQELILRNLLESSSEEESSSVENSSSDQDDSDDDIWALYAQVLSNRYLESREGVARAPERLDWLLYNLDNGRFRQEVRITRLHFWELVNKIESHTVFQTTWCKNQRPVYHQLL